MTLVDTEMQRVDTINTLVPQPVRDDGAQGSESTEQLNFETQTQVVPRCSGRVRRQPDRYIFLGESYDMILDELNTEPVKYNEAFQDKDGELWKKVIKLEMESMYSN